MILKEQNNQEIILGNVDTQMFSIDDSNAMIFDILRNKLYSNKIGSISREIASNSRDAHRESGTDKNIEIEFTNDNFLSAIGDTSIIFRDYGIGISPDRMETIFLKYAASTKRDSDLQTGGFGIGSKTPFCYTDSFVIKTINEGVEYVYNAIIDSTGKGKMIKISELPTENHSGTEIIIPILSNDDRYKFEKEVYKSTMYWAGVSYINFKTSKPQFEYIIEEKDFKITAFKDASFVGLLDGIPYEIKPENAEVISGHTVFLDLDMSKLTINANRESLQYDEQTIAHVNEVYNSFKETLSEIVSNFLSTNTSFLEAYEKLKKLKNYYTNETVIERLFRGLKSGNFNSLDYSVTFNGEKVDKISLVHHSVLLVKWTGINSKYTSSTLSLDYPIVYLDKGAVKVPKNEKLDKFYLIKPDKSVLKEALEVERNYLENLGIKLINYSEVKPDKVYVKPVKSDKVRICLREFNNYYNSNEKYFDKTLKTLIGADPSKIAFKVTQDFRSNYTFRNPNFSSDKLKLIQYSKGIEQVYFVNEANYRNYLKPNGYKTIDEVYNTINLKDFDKYVEINKIRNTLDEIPEIVMENFPEILPESILKFKREKLDGVPIPLKHINWHNLGMQSSKFDYKGVVKKYEERLRMNYPMLPAYLNHYVQDKEEKIKNIKKYIELTKK